MLFTNVNSNYMYDLVTKTKPSQSIERYCVSSLVPFHQKEYEDVVAVKPKIPKNRSGVG